MNQIGLDFPFHIRYPGLLGGHLVAEGRKMEDSPVGEMPKLRMDFLPEQKMKFILSIRFQQGARKIQGVALHSGVPAAEGGQIERELHFFLSQNTRFSPKFQGK